MDLREEGKAHRRERILLAAKTLLEREGAAGLTMRAIARMAHVAEVTPYNLFGSKAGIVEGLFDASASFLRALSSTPRSVEASVEDPIARLYAGTDMLIRSWASNALFMRELMCAARECGVDLARIAQRPTRLLEGGIRAAQEAGLLSQEIPLAVLSRHIFLANQAAFDAWASRQSDEQTFRQDLRNNLTVALLAVATPLGREQILTQLHSKEREPASRARPMEHPGIPREEPS